MPNAFTHVSTLLHILIGEILVTSLDVALELLEIIIPEFGSLAVEWGSATQRHESVKRQKDITTLANGCSLVRLPQQTLQRQQHALDIEHSTPLVFEDIEADPSLHVDVGVVDGRREAHLWWNVGVARRELEVEFERKTGVGCAVWTDDGAGPVQ